MNENNCKPGYGHLDTSYQCAGGETGIRQLVDAFYEVMSSNSAYQRIYQWHPDIPQARDKLARFLCGWLGGPKRYQEKYGSISIPRSHAHLAVSEIERDQWLACMAEALEHQEYPESFKTYLMEQLSKPAELIRKTCEGNIR